MRITTIIILLFFSFTFGFGQNSIEDFNLNYGDFSVGFKHYKLIDSTRTYIRHLDYTNEWQHREIPVSLWYPSSDFMKVDLKKIDDKSRLSVKDYFKILAEEEEWENLPDDYFLNWFWYIPNNENNHKHLQLKTLAFSNTPEEKGKFPVIIYAPSYQASSVENFAICEYLASHGYIVISSPSRGTYNRKFEGGTARDMETQAMDISFLISHSFSIPNADIGKIGTFGFSFGGLSNVLAQMKDLRIQATASLDGSIKYQYNTLEESPFFNLERATVPFIHIAQKEIPEIVLKEDKIDPKLNTEFVFWDKLDNADGYKAQMHDMAHSNFGAFSILFEDRDTRQEESDEKILASYGLSGEILKTFFDHYLKGKKKSKMEDFSEKEVVSLQIKKKPKPKLTVEQFLLDASAAKFANLNKLYKEYKNIQPSFEIPEGILNHKGLRLSFDLKTVEQGYIVFEFATKLYPESSNLEDSWAEGYWTNGNYKKAKIHFEKSLKLNPENQNAIDRLNELSDEK